MTYLLKEIGTERFIKGALNNIWQPDFTVANESERLGLNPILKRIKVGFTVYQLDNDSHYKVLNLNLSDPASWELMTNPIERIIFDYFNYSNRPVREFDFTFGKDSSSNLRFYCPEPIHSEDLAVGKIYQVFSEINTDTPLFAFELLQKKHFWMSLESGEYIWECIGADAFSVLSRETGIKIYNDTRTRTKFKPFLQRVMQDIKAKACYFSDSTEFIEDVDFFIEDPRYNTAPINIFNYFRDDLGFDLFIDSDLKLHAKDSSSVSNRIVNIDCDPGILERNFYFNQAASVPSQIRVIGENVVSQNTTTEVFQFTGDPTQDIFTLSEKPGNSNRVVPSFNVSNEIIEFDDPSLPTGDEIINKESILRLQVNNLPGESFSSQYRIWNDRYDASSGLSVGHGLQVNQITGKAGILGITRSFNNNIQEWLAGFFLEDLKLRAVVNGIIQNDFIHIVPSIERTITGIGGNLANVDDATGFQVGETLIFLQDFTTKFAAEVVEVNTITNTITFDREIVYEGTIPNKLVQLADYIIKIFYIPGRLIIQAGLAREINFNFVTLFDQAINFNQDSVNISIYANEEHEFSITPPDLTTNETFEIIFNTEESGNRRLDSAFEESGRELQDEAVIFQDSDDSKWKIKFETPLASVIQEIISESQYKLPQIIFDDGRSYKVGERILVAKQFAFIQSIDSSTNTITLDRNISGVTLNDIFYQTDVHGSENETLTVSYKAVGEEDLGLCVFNNCYPASCVQSESIIKISDEISYENFVLRAESEKDKICLPSIAGTYEMMIDVFPTSSSEKHKLLSDIPFPGERIQLEAFKKTDFDMLEGIVESVQLKEVNRNQINCIVSIGNEDNTRFLRSYLTLNKRFNQTSTSSNPMIDSNLPDNRVLCKLVSQSESTVNEFTQENVDPDKVTIWDNKANEVYIPKMGAPSFETLPCNFSTTVWNSDSQKEYYFDGAFSSEFSSEFDLRTLSCTYVAPPGFNPGEFSSEFNIEN